MRAGFWGGKFPLLNIITSHAIFFVLQWRLSFLKFKNRIRNRGSVPAEFKKDVQVAQLEDWLSKGFDRLNIGGGAKNLDGFVNIDFVAHPGVSREIVANILDLSFIPDNVISQVHSNHVIEHLSDHELVKQLAQYRRILKAGGLLSIRCPNAIGVAYGFWFTPILECEKDEFVELGFPGDEDFGNPADRWVHRDLYGLIHWIYADVGNIKNQHLNILTPTKLVRYLQAGGFQLIKMSEPEALNLVVLATSI